MGGKTSKIELKRAPMSGKPIYKPPHGTENGSLLNATTTLNGHAPTPSTPTPPPYSTDNPKYHSYTNGCSKPKKQKKGDLIRIPQSFLTEERKVLHKGTGANPEEGGRLHRGHPATEKMGAASSENRCWWLLLAVCSVINVIILVLIVLLSLELKRISHGKMLSNITPPSLTSNTESPTTLPLKAAEGSALPEDAPFCLPCSDVYLTQLEVTQNLHGMSQKMDTRSKTLLCCADSHDNLELLLGGMYTRVQYSKDRANGKVKVLKEKEEGEKSMSHSLQLFYDSRKQPQEVNGKFTLPLTTQGRQFSSTSVMFQDGVVRVNNTGHFYIYSQVPFEFFPLPSSSSSPSLSPNPSTTSLPTTSGFLPLSQQVVKIRNSGEETVLLENSMFPCDINAKQSGQHSFVAGVFHLVEGDAIAVRVSDHRKVKKREEMQFGIHRI